MVKHGNVHPVQGEVDMSKRICELGKISAAALAAAMVVGYRPQDDQYKNKLHPRDDLLRLT